MAIIKQYDKRSGLTYAYESHSYWDKEKKMTRAKRKLIGRVDPDTGEITPTDGRCRKDRPPKEEKPADYRAMYEKLEKRYIAQQALVAALEKELAKLRGRD